MRQIVAKVILAGGTVEIQSWGKHSQTNSAGWELFTGMKICNTKFLDVVENGKLRTVSLNEFHDLITDGETPALTKQGHNQLKQLIGILAKIQIEGDWLLQSPWAVPTEFTESDTGMS